MKDQDGKYLSIPWSEPKYLGINWQPRPDRAPQNCMPEPYREIDRDAFLDLMFCGDHHHDGLTYRQVLLPDERAHAATMFYHFHDTCLAVMAVYEGRGPAARPGTPVFGDKAWGYRLRFFQVGCAHPRMESVWVAMHDREDRCPDCGYRATYDTSG